MTAPNVIDERFPLFVTYASLEAFRQLQEVLDRWKVKPSMQIISDAAQYGCRKAMEEMFPGLPESPFSRKPLEDVLVALRFFYEQDERSRRSILEESSRRPNREVVPAALGAVRLSQAAVRHDPSDTSQRSSPQVKVPGDSQAAPAHIRQSLSAIRRDAVNPPSRLAPVPLSSPAVATASTPAPDDPASDAPYGNPSDTTQKNASPGLRNPAAALVSPESNLKRVGPAPVFPWEKIQKRGG